MKVLLVALNAKYIHSNPAVYSLRAYSGDYGKHCKIIELTINHSDEEILREIYKEKADVIAFSCYIWNIETINRITKELKKVQPEAELWLGGPEVSYDAKDFLRLHKELKGIIIGEGEQTFLELLQYYAEGNKELGDIKGIAYRRNISGVESPYEEGDIIITPPRELLDFRELPFPYDDILAFQNRIIYYESSRGCPFSCSYCLSSVDKTLRFRSIDLVKKELGIFLEHKVPQVKFVDRTFNCNKEHAMAIWQFIKENDNGVTNFHFEISADLLTPEEIDFLSTLRPGQIQFEIGVQTTNPETVKAIHRRMNLDKLKANVLKLKESRNIHQHLDLIAGLPLENLSVFEKSFQYVYSLKPDQLQLGFLKVLKGAAMESDSKTYGIVYRDTAPYEVLYTGHMSYDDILLLKGICEMVEVYYNSGQFTYSIEFLEHFYLSPMKLYQELSQYYEEMGYHMLSHNRLRRYEILLEFFKRRGQTGELVACFEGILLLDLYLRENLKGRPGFLKTASDGYNLKEYYDKYKKEKRTIHIEPFSYDVIASARSGKPIAKKTLLMFDYDNRDPLSKAAKLTDLSL